MDSPHDKIAALPNEPIIHELVHSLLTHMPESNMGNTQKNIDTIFSILNLWDTEVTKSCELSCHFWVSLNHGFRDAVVMNPQHFNQISDLLLTCVSSLRSNSKLNQPYTFVSAMVTISSVIQVIDSKNHEIANEGDDHKKLVATLVNELLHTLKAVQCNFPDYFGQESIACGIAVALTFSVPEVYVLDQAELEFVLELLVELLISYGLKFAPPEIKSPALTSFLGHMFLCTANMLSRVALETRLIIIYRIKDFVQSFSFLNTAVNMLALIRHESEVFQSIKNSVASSYPEVENGTLLFVSTLSIDKSIHSDNEKELWILLIGILGCLKDNSKSKEKHEILLQLCTRLESCEINFVLSVFRQIPPIRSVRNSNLMAILTGQLQPFIYNQLYIPSSENISGLHRMASMWVYPVLLERWVSSVGYLMHESLNRAIPFILEFCSKKCDNVSNRTFRSAHRVIWMLISNLSILYGAEYNNATTITKSISNNNITSSTSTIEDSDSSTKPHTARHRLICFYFFIITNLKENAENVGITASAFGLLLGGLGQLESELGVCLFCINMFQNKVIDLIRIDPNLSKNQTRKYASILFEMLKVSSPRLIQSVLKSIEKFLLESFEVLSPEGKVEIGSLLYAAVAYKCEVGRRQILCIWYQSLARSRL